MFMFYLNTHDQSTGVSGGLCGPLLNAWPPPYFSDPFTVILPKQLVQAYEK